MRIRIEKPPEYKYNWHSWFAWYPVPVYVGDEEFYGTWVWLEKVERVYEYSFKALRPAYSLPPRLCQK